MLIQNIQNTMGKAPQEKKRRHKNKRYQIAAAIAHTYDRIFPFACHRIRYLSPFQTVFHDSSPTPISRCNRPAAQLRLTCSPLRLSDISTNLALSFGLLASSIERMRAAADGSRATIYK